jgi:beta-N-acetylglucosaminidase
MLHRKEAQAPLAVPVTAAPATTTPTTNAPVTVPRPAEWLVLAVMLVSLAICSFFWIELNARWQNPETTTGQPQGQPQAVISLDQANTLVSRGSQLISMDIPAKGWATRLADGQADPADYLMRLFTSPAYLASNADDREFLRDATWVVRGSQPDDTALAAAETELSGLGSRLAYLNALVKAQGWPGGISLPDEPTRLRTYQLVDNLPVSGSEVIGLLPISSEVRLTGRDARFKIFVDGRFRLSDPIESAEPSIQNVYITEWDTRGEEPGNHAVALLVLTSDGRGQWVEIANYVLPVVETLAVGEVQTVTLEQAGSLVSSDRWYALPIDDSQALLLALDAQQPLQLDLLDLHGQTLAQTTGAVGQPATLRYRFSEETAPESVFVRISLAAGSDTAGGTAAAFSLVPALAAARPTDGTASWQAVLARQDEQLRIRDSIGEIRWLPMTDYELVDPTAHLAQIALDLPGGEAADLAPAFSPAVLEYGLYVAAANDQLNWSALPMEGSAASLAITITPGDQDSRDPAADQSGDTTIMLPGEPLRLPAGESTLRLDVTGYDGSTRQYNVHILRSPDTAGYSTTLEQFPLSYRSRLYLLHINHPAWQFIPSGEAADWDSFLAAQDEGGLNLANAGDSPASWIEPDSPVYDGSSWKAATRQVIAHFADPRNALDEVNIFQFEKLDFQAAVHTKAGISAITGESFMDGGNAQGLDYAALILDAGRQAGISPNFLAAKIIQEMGRQGESPLATGTLDGYDGVYNFYNIGATPDPEIANGAQVNGAMFALYGRNPGTGEITPEEALWLIPWTTPQRAISGGAIWIAERYVRIGQDTLYLQKFDLIAQDGLYIHQYAQNIQMAWAEGRRTRASYVELGLLDEPFVFSVPVFSGLPDQPATLP